MLARLPVEGRAAVLEAARPRTWRPGELLTHDGDEATCLIIITSGSAIVRLSSAAGQGAALAVLGPGDVLGEVGLVHRRTERTADVSAVDAVTGLVLTRTAFDAIRVRSPEVNDFIMQLMANRIDRLSHRVIEAYHTPVAQRVARRLHELARRQSGNEATLHITQSDLGDLTGATRPSVNAVLRDLETRGVVQLGRAKVRIVDRVLLRKECS